MMRCDIIIPIYNAYECVIECIESVLKNTDFDFAHLILIDDKSPDKRMIPLLQEYAEKNPEKITFLRNKTNLGFVGTVNKGMKYSKNDVLLLNSDTEVPKGWLKRIQKCAYSGEMIATVTPLSNNATLASVPKSFKENELPADYSLEKMNKVVRKCSLKMYPEIPTAHGFCMYIKREALNRVGLFDEETFGRGYGEENDFCFRCMRLGYRNLLCDDVYVLHKESKSFLDAKEDHSSLLRKKHPSFAAGLNDWCRRGGIEIVGKRIALEMGMQEGRPNILVVIHDFTSVLGGTTLHVSDLVHALRKEYNFHILYRDGLFYKVRSFFKDSDVVTTVCKAPMDLTRAKSALDLAPSELYSNEYSKMLEDIIERYKISFVHVHHILWHYFDLIDVCKRKNIKYMVSLHDVYLYFPIANRFAEEVNNKVKPPIDLKEWRSVCGELLDGAEKIIAPSPIVKRKYESIYPNLKVDVIRHGVDLEKKLANHVLNKKIKNIAFVGGIGPSKGSEVLEGLLPELEKRGNIRVHLFGITTANVANSKIFINHGAYEREDLPKKIRRAKIDLVCNFSLIFETYAYVVDEVAASGVPILTFDYGASAERIKENNLGWTIKYTKDIKEIADTIIDILGSEDEYNEMMRGIRKYKVRSVEEMAGDYGEIYKKYVRSEELAYDEIIEGVVCADMVESEMKKTEEYKKALADLSREYSKVINSARWKMMERIMFPRWISKMIGKIVN